MFMNWNRARVTGTIQEMNGIEWHFPHLYHTVEAPLVNQELKCDTILVLGG